MPVRILIVEDDRVIRSLLQATLKMYSDAATEFLSAANGLEAIEIVRNNPAIDVILTDIRMPRLDGIEFARRVRVFSDVPIVALTAFGDNKTRQQASAAGISTFFVKPPNYEHLAKSLFRLARGYDSLKNERLLTLHRRLGLLKEQAAYHGIDTPPAITLEIQDIERQLGTTQDTQRED